MTSETEQRLFVQIISVIGRLYHGERLVTKNGKLAMGEDYRIGYIMTNVATKEESVAGSVDISELVKIINRDGIIYEGENNGN